MTTLRSRIGVWDLVFEAGLAIVRRPGRSLLTALGTIAGVGAFVATTGLASTAQAQVGSSFDLLKATQVTITDLQADGTDPFPADAEQRLDRLNGVNSAGITWTVNAGDLEVRALPSLGTSPTGIPVVAASPGAVNASAATIGQGISYNEFHEKRAEHVVLLGAQAAAQLGISTVNSGTAIFIGDTTYSVLGIITASARTPNWMYSVVIPTSAASTLNGQPPSDYEVLIDVRPGAANLIGDQAPLALRPQQPDRLHAQVPPDPRQLREQIESDVTSLLYGLAGLALLVGMIGIANTTLVAVLERRAEIGVRRALGARGRHIAAQFLAESAALGTIGGVIGTSLGIIIVSTIATARSWTTTLNPLYTLPAPAVGLAAGLIAGLQPAWRATRITPATALRGE
ncbi:MAG: transporter [Ilumatobacteraceae bacterium]|nr:transporter [Ilumatobacteraceae bacterium]